MKNAILIFFILWTAVSPSMAGENAPPKPKNETVLEVSSEPVEVSEKIVPPSEPSEKITPIKTEQIDKAGEKMSVGIEKFSRYAESRVGGWINTKAFAGISWMKLLVCLALLFLVVICERILFYLIQRKIKAIPVIEGTISWYRIFLKAVSRPVTLFIWIYGIYAALSPLYGHFKEPDGENMVHFVAQKVADIGGSVALFWFLFELVSVLENRLHRWADRSDSSVDKMLVPIMGKTFRLFIVLIGAIVVLQNLTGVKIGPLLASLGIGGLAVALAAKDSIANFFGTLTILFDKPFQVGERIVIDKYDGSVEHVGFRSTRIRLLNGHLVTIPNEKIVNSGLENIGQRPFIRWVAHIGITYTTPYEKIQKATEILKEIVDNHEGYTAEFPPRVFFNGFNDWSLNIMVIVWYHPPEYWDYQALIQRICLEIKKRFDEEEIHFAFPSRTLYLENSDHNPLLFREAEEERLVMDSAVKPRNNGAA